MSKRKATQVTQFYLLQLIDGNQTSSWLIPESDVSEDEVRLLRNCAGHSLGDDAKHHVVAVMWRADSKGYWDAGEHFPVGDPRFDETAEEKWKKYTTDGPNGVKAFGFEKPIKAVYQCFAD